LSYELCTGPTRRCGSLRQIINEIYTGVRSVAEKDMQTLVRRGGLPEPRYNARLYALDGTFIAMVDAWWEEAGVALQVDSVAYHSSVAAQDKDRENSATLVKHGVHPLRFSPRRIRDEKESVLSDIRAVLHANGRQVPLPVVAVGPDETWTPEAAAAMRARIDLARAGRLRVDAGGV
jgi:very-short-patch-repair endonuclease